MKHARAFRGALRYAYDSPAFPFFPLLCNLCGTFVRRKHAERHLVAEHPSWTLDWNTAKDAGL